MIFISLIVPERAKTIDNRLIVPERAKTIDNRQKNVLYNN